jgi:hypothetical protein
MKDGEVRLKEALPFPGVFRNCGFQSGDDECFGGFDGRVAIFNALQLACISKK